MTHVLRLVFAAGTLSLAAAALHAQPATTEPVTPAATPALTPCEDLAAKLRESRSAEWKAKAITLGGKTMKFDFKVFGDAPATGRSLFISMHGGGGAPAKLNDQQWNNQIGLYTPEEGVYLAPRAPTDTWNLWHEAHIDTFFDRIIENAVLFEGVNPDRVYLMGYSAGGDGVYQVAPRMADRFAAASMMAGHPNEASPINLANLPFMLWVGEKDAAYNRNTVTKEWGAKLDALQKEFPNAYTHELHVVEGAGHWMNRVDAAALKWMAGFTRNPWPKSIRWRQDDVTHSRFYWLGLDDAGVAAHVASGGIVSATVQGNEISLQVPEGIDHIDLFLSDRLLDVAAPINITWNDTRFAPIHVAPASDEITRAELERHFDTSQAATSTLRIERPTPSPATK